MHQYHRIAAAVEAHAHARTPQQGAPAVTLIAVSKAVEAAAIFPVLDAGCRDFGENRAQPMREKWGQIRADLQASGRAQDIPRLHFIGQIQSRKAKSIVEYCEFIHSLDRESLASACATAESELGVRRKYFVQVDEAGETQKGGIALAQLAEFVAMCVTRYALNVVGLMTLPPQGKDPAPYFASLQTAAAELDSTESQPTPASLFLSMGMTADYPVAIAHGATHVRIGSAIFS